MLFMLAYFHFSVGQEIQRLSLCGVQIVNEPPFSLVSLSIRKEKEKKPGSPFEGLLGMDRWN